MAHGMKGNKGAEYRSGGKVHNKRSGKTKVKGRGAMKGGYQKMMKDDTAMHEKAESPATERMEEKMEAPDGKEYT